MSCFTHVNHQYGVCFSIFLVKLAVMHGTRPDGTKQDMWSNDQIFAIKYRFPIGFLVLPYTRIAKSFPIIILYEATSMMGLCKGFEQCSYDHFKTESQIIVAER